MSYVKSVAVIFVAILIIVISSLTALHRLQIQPRESLPSPLNLQKLIAIYIGDKYTTLVTGLINKFEGIGVRVLRFNDISDSAMFDGEMHIVILNGDWLRARVDDTRLYEFLRKAVESGARLVAVEGATSTLFEALDKAGIHKLPVDEYGNVRNPAHFNPPLAGFKLAQHPDGYKYPSILTSASHDIDTLFEAIMNWAR